MWGKLNKLLESLTDIAVLIVPHLSRKIYMVGDDESYVIALEDYEQLEEDIEGTFSLIVLEGIVWFKNILVDWDVEPTFIEKCAIKGFATALEESDVE